MSENIMLGIIFLLQVIGMYFLVRHIYRSLKGSVQTKGVVKTLLGIAFMFCLTILGIFSLLGFCVLTAPHHQCNM